MLCFRELRFEESHHENKGTKKKKHNITKVSWFTTHLRVHIINIQIFGLREEQILLTCEAHILY